MTPLGEPLFQQALGADWADLPSALRVFHGETGADRFTGEVEVTRGRHPLARLAATLFRFPPEAARVPVAIRIIRDGGGEDWLRDFGGHRLRSRLTPAGPGRICERLGPAAFELALRPVDRGLEIAVVSGRLFALPLPGAMLPRSDAREIEATDRFHFDIAVALPLLGPMIRYRGWLEPERSIALSHPSAAG